MLAKKLKEELQDILEADKDRQKVIHAVAKIREKEKSRRKRVKGFGY